jgi:hypothetical protein
LPVFHSFLPTQFAPRFADAAGDSLRGGGGVFLAGALCFVGDLVPFHSVKVRWPDAGKAVEFTHLMQRVM